MKQLFLALCTFLTASIFAQNYEAYNWQHVPIGGGGYITGMQIHPKNSDVRYYRTDVGGAYKWDKATQSLKQLVFSTEKEHYSVAGIALNPDDPSQVFLAMSRNCNNAKAAIYKSYNYGEKFEIVDKLPFYFAANGGRGCSSNVRCTQNKNDKDRQGTPIAINPLKTNELYIGTREKGLYIMDLKNNNQVRRVAENVLKNNNQCYSIRSVVFHPTQKNRVFIGYANQGVFTGDTKTNAYWQLGKNFPSELKQVSDISISKNGDYMLVACKKEGIMRRNNPTGSADWQKVLSWQKDDNDINDEGYLTVECSPHSNETAITVTGGAGEINNFQFTTNKGGKWTIKKGTVTTNLYGYKKYGFGSHISQIRFDPNNNKGLYFTSWFSTYHTSNWTVDNVNWSNLKSKGHEEVVPTDLTTFPKNQANNFLLIHSGDHSGFIYNNISAGNYPKDILRDRIPVNQRGDMVKGSNSDFCEKAPKNIVCNFTTKWNDADGKTDNTGSIVVSNDGGATFKRLSSYNKNLGKSLVAMSSTTPSNIVIANRSGVQYIKNGMSNFSPVKSTGNINNPNCGGTFKCKNVVSNLKGKRMNSSVFAPARVLVADKVHGCVFYFYDYTNGNFHASTNGGESWCVVNDNDLPKVRYNKTRLTAIPGNARHLWINFENALFHSNNGGQNWEKISSVDRAISLAAGKAAPGSNYPTLYLFGSLTGVGGDFFYRSTDKGKSWTKIGDRSKKQLWGEPQVIEADRNVYGRVYAGIEGQGVVYGEIQGEIDCPPAGTACNDGNPATQNDVTDGNCNCVGTGACAEQLANASFASGSNLLANWTVHKGDGAQANGSINQFGVAHVNINQPGNANYSVQLWQDGLAIKANKTYKVTGKIRANGNRTATLVVRPVKSPDFYMTETINLSSQFEPFNFQFTGSVNESNVRLSFLLGANSEDVFIDEVSFKEDCNPCAPKQLIQDGRFDQKNSNNVVGWKVHANSGAAMNGKINEFGVAHLNITKSGANNYDLQLWQDGLSIEAGNKYVARVRMRANKNRTVRLIARPVQMSNEEAFFAEGDHGITTDFKEYFIDFTANRSESNARFSILMGGNDADVFIDYVTFSKVCNDNNGKLAATEILNPTVANIYPNPVNDYLNVELIEGIQDAEISLFDLTGKLVLTQQTGGTKTALVDLSGLAAGSYFVRFQTGEAVSVKRIVKY